MSGVEALRLALLEYAISEDRSHAVSHGEQAERILADPAPLLAALAEAGVLREECGKTFSTTHVRWVPERRYVSEWEATS